MFVLQPTVLRPQLLSASVEAFNLSICASPAASGMGLQIKICGYCASGAKKKKELAIPLLDKLN